MGSAGRGGFVEAPPADPGSSMWAWGADQHARFWSRRQLHETLVHRCDLELAQSGRPSVPAHLAADTIDEFLDNLAAFAEGVLRPVAGL